MFATLRPSTRKSRSGSGQNQTARLLKANIATESAFWPPIQGSRAFIHLSVVEGWWLMPPGIMIEAASDHGYITVKDVVQTLLCNTASLKTVKDSYIGIDNTCFSHARLSYMSAESSHHALARVDLHW